MFARVPDTGRSEVRRRPTDTERLEKIQRAAELISKQHTEGKITSEQMIDMLRQLQASSSNGILRMFGM